MTILPSLKDDTFRLLKNDSVKKMISILECDTKCALQTDSNSNVTYSVTELAATKTKQDFNRKFSESSSLLAKPVIALFKEKSDISFGELDDLVCQTKKTFSHSYQTCDKYPLLAIVDERQPSKILLSNLAD